MTHPTEQEKHDAEEQSRHIAQSYAQLTTKVAACVDLTSSPAESASRAIDFLNRAQESWESALCLRNRLTTLHRAMAAYDSLPKSDTPSDRVDANEANLRYTYVNHITGIAEMLRNDASENISRTEWLRESAMRELSEAEKSGDLISVERLQKLVSIIDEARPIPPDLIHKCQEFYDSVKASHDPWFNAMEEGSLARHRRAQ